MDINFSDCWKEALKESLEKPYFETLKAFLAKEDALYRLYPNKEDIFRAFEMTPFRDVKVVILGQDPYHGAHQAHGLSFSVNDGIAHPPSLRNIFKELKDDVHCAIPKSGNLSAWAKQGVFLLNTVLTVREGEAHSHKGQGWEIFTDDVIRLLSTQKEHLVFILWGGPALAKTSLIDSSKHCIIHSAHPSPLSSYRGFFGSKPFSKTNVYLTCKGQKAIEWSLE